MQEDFDSAAARIKPVVGPNNEEMLELYGLFKQATVGDNNTREDQQQQPSWAGLMVQDVFPPQKHRHCFCLLCVCVRVAKPGMLDLKGKRKWEFWNNRKGKAAVWTCPVSQASVLATA